MAKTPDSTNPGDAPLEADLPQWDQTTRGLLDQPQPGATATYSPDELADQLEEVARERDGQRTEDRWSEPDPKTRTNSSPGSTSPPPNVDVANSFANLASLIVQLASAGLNIVIGRRTGAWLATEEEAANIAQPLGRIAERHMPIEGGNAGDLADGIEALYYTGEYGVRATLDQIATAPQPGDV
jgi:hypothetical protein